MSETQFKIDEITWNDLDMDEVFGLLDHCGSSVGSEYLKEALKTPAFSSDFLKTRNNKIRYFSDHEQEQTKLAKCFRALGKTKKFSFLDYIFRLKEVPSRSNAVHFVLIALLIIAIVLIFLLPAAGIVAFVIMIAVNIIVYFKVKSGIEGYFICLKYLVSMVVCAQGVLSSHALEAEVFAEDAAALKECVKIFAPLKRGSWLITNSVSGSLVDVIMDYVRMIFHVDLIKFNNMRNTAMEHETQIRLLYDTLGEIELDMCVAQYRKTLGTFCEPVFYSSFEDRQSDSLSLIAQEIVHPLVKEPVANSISTETSVLLTGSNASGKSTFLKTLAVNQIFAQTICTCLAKQFLTSFFKVMSSMALSDNLLGKESYFIVEIKSLKRIFDEQGEIPVMCFIDEVLRGTNTIERISASSKLLENLCHSNMLVFAATHDIELTSLLNFVMDNYHFSEQVTGGVVTFDYLLKPGAASSSNAIKLMESFGFDETLVSDARKRAEDFRKNGVWK